MKINKSRPCLEKIGIFLHSVSFPRMRDDRICVLGNLLNINSAFTVIEIIVSIAVILLVIGITLAGYSNLNRRQALISAGQTMKNILRDVQSRAFTGEIDCNVCDCTISSLSTITGWYVDFSSNTIYGQCDSNDFSSSPIGLSADVKITPYLDQPPRLHFRSYPPSVNQEASLCLTYDNLPGSFYQINIERSGDISDTGILSSTCP